MFCSTCGQPVDEGKAFCRYCGTPIAPPVQAPAPDDSPTAQTSADEAATIVLAPDDFPTAETPVDQAATIANTPAWSDARTVVLPDPSEAATRIVPPAPSEAETFVAAPSAALPAVAGIPHVVPPPVTGAGAAPGGYPPSAARPAVEHTAIRPRDAYPPDYPAYLEDEPEPRRGGRGGLIAAFIIAIVILAAAVAATTTLLVRDNGGSASGTTASVSTTAAPDTSTTLAPDTTTTAAETTSTESSTTSESPTTSEVSAETYLTLMNAVLGSLTDDDEQIPVLAKQINSTAPDVPQSVTDALQKMLDKLNGAMDEFTAVSVPPPWNESDALLKKAAGYMVDRIQATIDGVEAYRDGDSTAATKYFKLGQQARDDYRATMLQFEDVRPNH